MQFIRVAQTAYGPHEPNTNRWTKRRENTTDKKIERTNFQLSKYGYCTLTHKPTTNKRHTHTHEHSWRVFKCELVEKQRKYSFFEASNKWANEQYTINLKWIWCHIDNYYYRLSLVGHTHTLTFIYFNVRLSFALPPGMREKARYVFFLPFQKLANAKNGNGSVKSK